MPVQCPVHVTLRVRPGVPSLRGGALVHEWRRSLAEANERGDFRVAHYSLQGDHAHLIVEAHGTFFACTNAGSSNTTLGVEVFGGAGETALNNADATSIIVAPGATVRFGTTPAAGLTIDASLAPGVVLAGSARVLATNPRYVLCSAFLADANFTPPTSMTSLSVVKKTSQQGD